MSYPTVSRGPLALEVLVWVTARNRDTGDPETMGLWTGLDRRAFTVDAAARTYEGAGAVLEVADIVTQAGLSVQMQSAALAILTPEVELLIRGYDARQAPVEVHLARFDPETDALLGIDRVFRGWLDSAKVRDGAKGGQSSLSARLASSARALTIKVPRRRSNVAHQAAHPGDGFFRHADVSGMVPVWWGQKRKAPLGPVGGADIRKDFQ